MAASPDEILALIFFARVVEAKSFTGAAAKLGVSKSVVSARDFAQISRDGGDSAKRLRPGLSKVLSGTGRPSWNATCDRRGLIGRPAP